MDAATQDAVTLFFFSILLPCLVAGGTVWLMVRRAKRPSIKVEQQSPTRLIQPAITLADVGGADAAVRELREIVNRLKGYKQPGQRGLYLPSGILPSGILLTGDPGTGKTRLARAIGGEARLPFFEASGPDFIGSFIGGPAVRLRSLFIEARQKRPCIVFIDQIDDFARQRAGSTAQRFECEQALSQLFVGLDNLGPYPPVLVIAATNRPDLLDPALLRSGRFERQIHLDRPDAAGRERILRLHTVSQTLEAGIDLSRLAAETEGFVGADLARVINEAGLNAVRAQRAAITQADLDAALRLVAEDVRPAKAEG